MPYATFGSGENSHKKKLALGKYLPKGAFTNYVYKIWLFFDHLPEFVRFLGEFEDTKKSFRNYLTLRSVSVSVPIFLVAKKV